MWETARLGQARQTIKYKYFRMPTWQTSQSSQTRKYLIFLLFEIIQLGLMFRWEGEKITQSILEFNILEGGNDKARVLSDDQIKLRISFQSTAVNQTRSYDNQCGWGLVNPKVYKKHARNSTKKTVGLTDMTRSLDRWCKRYVRSGQPFKTLQTWINLM